MKKKIAFWAIVCLITVLNGCGLLSSTSYTSPEVLLTSDFSRDSIAVFDFNTDGSGLSPSIGKIAADKLSESLFLKGKMKIIDRTSVNQAIASLSINPDQFDDKVLADFGAATGAKYVIVGRINASSDSDFWSSKAQKRIGLSFRIISTGTGDVVGGASISAQYEKNQRLILGKMIDKVVDKMKAIK